MRRLMVQYIQSDIATERSVYMDIRCTQNIFQSANGSSKVSYYILMPEGVPTRGVVQIVHGMCEYFSRYTVFAKYLCQLGYVVCGHDQIGHGASASKQSELGYFAPRDGWKYLIEDVGKLREIMQKRYPELPYFLFGHSMGSMIARLYLAEHGEGLAGAVICGTVGPNPAARMGIQMANSTIGSRGMHYRSAMLHSMAFSGYNKRFKDENNEHAWLTRDHAIVDMYQADEKCNFIFTAVGFRDLFNLVYRCNRRACYRATPHTLPVLLIAGDQDPVGNYGKGVRRVAAMYKANGQKDLDLIFYKDCRHEILNEINKLDVFADISRWLEEKLPKE